MPRLCLLFLSLTLISATAVAQKPLKVFVLAGQSNMQGHAQVRTFEHLAMSPETAPMLEDLQNADGSPRVCEEVWISSIGSSEEELFGPLTVGFGASQNPAKIGPELTFGIYLHKAIDGPILLIKTAWGGKSLHTDFRSPSSGPFKFSESQLEGFRKQNKDIAEIEAEKSAATGHYYRLMIEHVKSVLADIGRIVPDYDPAVGYELSGFVWFQGWNDMVDGGVYPDRYQPGGYDAYSTAMANFIRDVRTDLQTPELPFVIGVLGVGGPVSEYGPDQQRYKGVHQYFRDAMAAPAKLPEFQGNVATVLTENYWDRELTAAKAKEQSLRQQAKKTAAENKLSAAQERELLEKLLAEQLTERERDVIAKGISNLEFHYLGSAKILGGIGKGFAEAMTTLLQQSKAVN